MMGHDAPVNQMALGLANMYSGSGGNRAVAEPIFKASIDARKKRDEAAAALQTKKKETGLYDAVLGKELDDRNKELQTIRTARPPATNTLLGP